MIKTQQTLERIQVAKRAVGEELDRHIAGRPTVGTLSQLKTVQQKLIEMEQLITNVAIPPKFNRDRGMGRMISDSWPLGSALGEIVLAAEEAFLRL